MRKKKELYPEDKLLQAVDEVIEDADIADFILFVIFFPISLFYLIFRIFQEIGRIKD